MHEEVVAASKQHVIDKGTNDAGAYQMDAKAEDECGDVKMNQEDFSTYIHQALRGLCQSGIIGDAEILLIYAFREPDIGDLKAGTIHGHSKHNKTHFGGDELELTYGVPWAKFADTVIPRPVVYDSPYPITVTEDGVVVVPSIELDEIPPATLRHLLEVFFEKCWRHRQESHGSLQGGTLPWDQIVLNPANFYDTEKFSFPFALKEPQTFTTFETLAIAEFLNSPKSAGFHFKNQPGVQPDRAISPPLESPPPSIRDNSTNRKETNDEAQVPDETATKKKRRGVARPEHTTVNLGASPDVPLGSHNQLRHQAAFRKKRICRPRNQNTTATIFLTARLGAVIGTTRHSLCPPRDKPFLPHRGKGKICAAANVARTVYQLPGLGAREANQCHSRRMFSRSDHHHDCPPQVPTLPSTTSPPETQPTPCSDRVRAHRHRLETLLESALTTLALIQDADCLITYTFHALEVLEAVNRRVAASTMSPPLVPHSVPPPASATSVSTPALPGDNTGPPFCVYHQSAEDFQLHNLESKKAAYDYLAAIRRLSDNSFTADIPNPYQAFLRVVRVFDSLMLRKRSGQLHSIDSVLNHRPKGNLLVWCPACPEPGFNSDPNYRKTPHHLRHLNQSQRTLDGNFHCNQFNKNTDPDDVSLCAGKGYFPLESEYKKYLGKIPVSKEACVSTTHIDDTLRLTLSQKSTCNYLKAVNKQDKSKFRNMEVTGTINCQCSHVFILSCVDLHHGERFANADMGLAMELTQHQPNEKFEFILKIELDDVDEITTYDIACEYFIHLEDRFKAHFPALLFRRLAASGTASYFWSVSK
ncbi:hypothetical protein B0H13DRAFT_1857533 [Mycena leptocephala]|nr:hypothetical protein B0H13DRAFT_1857533 [Mycena leptocephala]